MDLSVFVEDALNYIQTNLASAVIILLVGFIISYLLGRIIRKILKEVEIDNLAYKTFGSRLKLEKRISIFITYVFYVVTVFIALTKLLIGYYILIGIAIFLLAVVLPYMFLRIYDLFLDIISGIIVRRKSKFNENDLVSFGNLSGTVKKVSFTSIVLKNRGGDIIHIPFSTIRANLKNISIRS